MGQTMDDDVAILAPAQVAEGAPTGDGVAHLRTSLPSSTPTIGGSCSLRFFNLTLAAVTAGALALRIAYVLTVTRYQNGTLYDSPGTTARPSACAQASSSVSPSVSARRPPTRP